MIFAGLRRVLVRTFLYFAIAIWKLMARFGKLNVIKDGIIYPWKQVEETPQADFNGNVGKGLLVRMKRNLEKYGDYKCFVNGSYTLKGTTQSCGEKNVTLSKVIQTAEAFGAALYNAGLRKGDVVHFLLPNCTDYHALVIGVYMCNGVCSLGDPGLVAPVLKTQLQETKAKFVVCFQGSKQVLQKALEEMEETIQVIVLSSPTPANDEPLNESNFHSLSDFMQGDFKEPDVEDFDDDDTVVIFWSSGTTGQPKGIQHAVKTFQYVIGDMESRRPLNDVVGLTTTCFFHVGGHLYPFKHLVHEKAPLVFNHGPDLDNAADTGLMLFEEIDLFKPSYMMCGSHHMVLLGKAKPKESMDLSSPLLVMPMGSTVPKSLFDDLKQNLPSLQAVVHMYALTEVPTLGAFQLHSDYGLGGLGPLVVGKVVDPDTGKICGQDEIGELLLKSKITMKGYLNRPEENAKFFEPDGFVHTGDLVSYNHLGNLNYEGRCKDLIKYKNHHMYPLEIENVIQQHPNVIDVGVFGRPDPMVQELVTALVVKKPDSKLTENDIIVTVENALDDAKHLRGGVVFVDRLPKNPVGKMLRRNLIQVYDEQMK